MAAGGAVTTATPLLTRDELTGQLADAGASVVVTWPPCPTPAAPPGLPKGVELTHANLVANAPVDQVPRSPSGKLLRRVLVEAERAGAGPTPVAS
jgi:hypothetical protein